MSNNLLFFLFPAIFLVSSAFPAAETAEKDNFSDEGLVGEWFAAFDTEGCRKDKIKFFECAREVLNLTSQSFHDVEIRETSETFAPYLLKISDCMGEISCGPFALATYLTRNKMYQKECRSAAEECIKSSNIALISDYCTSKLTPLIDDKRSLRINTAACVAAYLNDKTCDKNERNMFMRSEFARMDLEEVMKSLEKADGKLDRTAVLYFKHKFNPEAYLEYEL